MNILKEVIVRRILAFAEQYVSLGEARVATLGGAGLEAEIWQQRGVPRPENAFLIERSPLRMRKLMRGYPKMNHFQGRIRDLPDVLARRYGDESGLDLFHWDLCGTVEPVIGDVVDIFPLLARSKGRTLAVTVADARRNRSLETPVDLTRIAQRIFGAKWPTLWNALMAQHTQSRHELPETVAHPKNVSLREVGVLVHLFLALSAAQAVSSGDEVMFRLPQGFKISVPRTGVVVLPDGIERYVYHSSGFRMRTYILHLAVRESPMTFEEAASAFVDLVVGSACRLMGDDGQSEIEVRTPSGASSEGQGMDAGMTSETVEAGQVVTETDTDDVAVRKRIAKLKVELEPAMQHVHPGVAAKVATLFALVESGETIERRVEAEVAKRMELVEARVLDVVIAALKDLRNEKFPKLPPITEDEEGVPASAPQVEPQVQPVANPEPTSEARSSHKEVEDEVRLELVEARKVFEAKLPGGEAAFKAARLAGFKKLGLKNDEHGRRTLASVLAHAVGKFQPNFFMRVMLAAGTDAERKRTAIQRLATIFDLTEKQVTTIARKSSIARNAKAAKEKAKANKATAS